MSDVPTVKRVAQLKVLPPTTPLHPVAAGLDEDEPPREAVLIPSEPWGDNDTTNTWVARYSFRRRLMQRIVSLAPTDAPLLICAPGQVGTEPFARCIHERSRRAAAPFARLDCRGLAAGTIDAVLLGISDMSDTADGSADSLLVLAEGGTLFLDEVACLHRADQVRLVRLLHESDYRPIGRRRTQPINVRVVAGTTADVTDAVGQNQFLNVLLACFERIG